MDILSRTGKLDQAVVLCPHRNKVESVALGFLMMVK